MARFFAATVLLLVTFGLGVFSLFSGRFGEFSPVSITGQSVLVQVDVIGTAYEMFCVVPVYPGWNLVSNPCIVDNSTVNLAFASLNGSFVSVHSYNGSSADRWKVYRPGLPSWVVQDLSEADVKRGYWLNASSSSSWNLNGTIFFPQAISLDAGWNLVGYPINQSKNFSAAFWSVSPGNITRIHAYNSSSGVFEFFYFSNGSGSLQALSSGRGYWVNVTNGSVWTLVE
ncbi:hypothetical protein HY640_00420 [Candidatus Woesearchaeota archaeon]|nr:hypothetical protein [Candidatus Woesearchaeota archaeon]